MGAAQSLHGVQVLDWITGRAIRRGLAYSRARSLPSVCPIQASRLAAGCTPVLYSPRPPLRQRLFLAERERGIAQQATEEPARAEMAGAHEVFMRLERRAGAVFQALAIRATADNGSHRSRSIRRCLGLLLCADRGLRDQRFVLATRRNFSHVGR